MGQVHHGYKLHTSVGDPSCIEAEESSPTERFWCSHRCKRTTADAMKERLNSIWLILLTLQKLGAKGKRALSSLRLCVYAKAYLASPLWFFLSRSVTYQSLPLLWCFVLLLSRGTALLLLSKVSVPVLCVRRLIPQSPYRSLKRRPFLQMFGSGVK